MCKRPPDDLFNLIFIVILKVGASAVSVEVDNRTVEKRTSTSPSLCCRELDNRGRKVAFLCLIGGFIVGVVFALLIGARPSVLLRGKRIRNAAEFKANCADVLALLKIKIANVKNPCLCSVDILLPKMPM